MPKAWPHSVNTFAQREFLDRYEQLLAWAVKLTGRRDVDAHDLVHDAFVAYSEGDRGDKIRNLNGYLYGMLRNLLRSERNRAETRLRAPWEVAETAPGGLRDSAVDAASQFEARQTLLQIARLARARSLQTKAGSALLLRYFHGYAPREIARIMRVPASNVDDWLKLGRREARAVAASAPTVDHQNASDGSTVRPFRRIRPTATGTDSADGLLELRREALHQPPGRCLSAWRLKRLYRHEPTIPIETKTLAHIVACAVCLDRVSDRLGFPGISERHPVDELIASTRDESKTRRRVAVGGALVLAAILALGPGRARVEAAASAFVRVARAVIGYVARPRSVDQHKMPALPSRPLSSFTPAGPARNDGPVVSRAPSRSVTRPISEAAVLGLEVEAFHLLDRHGALLGREFDLSRDRAGRVRFATLAANPEERARLQAALAPLARTSDFVQTIRLAEELPLPHSEIGAPSSVVVRDVELTQEATPLLEAVRQHIAEADIPRVVNRLMSGSRQARLHASLMQDLLRRFDAEKLRRLNPGAYATLDTMVRYHALGVARATERVRTELMSVILMADSVEPAPADALPTDDLAALLVRLRDQTALNDETLGVELAAAPVGEARTRTTVAELLRSLELAERLAERIAGI